MKKLIVILAFLFSCSSPTIVKEFKATYVNDMTSKVSVRVNNIGYITSDSILYIKGNKNTFSFDLKVPQEVLADESILFHSIFNTVRMRKDSSAIMFKDVQGRVIEISNKRFFAPVQRTSYDR